MNGEHIAVNLLRLRKERQKSQAELALDAGITRLAYSNIERKGALPRVSTLQALASALGVRLQDLLEAPDVLRTVRFRSAKSLRNRDSIILDVARMLRDYNDLEQLLGERIEYRLNSIPNGLAPVQAALCVRRSLDLQPEEPIRDVCGLLEDNAGIKVLRVPTPSNAFFGLSVGASDGGPAIAINTWEKISVERWIFSAAHELGHLVMHREDFDPRGTEENAQHEREADQFASHFLMPHSVFAREWNQASGLSLYARVMKVKSIFNVSYRTVLARVAESSGLGSSIYPRFQFAHKLRHGKTLKKTDEPLGVTPEVFSAPEPSRAKEPHHLSTIAFTEDRLYRLVREACLRELISHSRGAEILRIGLKEMRQLSEGWANSADYDEINDDQVEEVYSAEWACR